MNFILIMLSIMAILLFIFMLGGTQEGETQQDKKNYTIGFVVTVIAIVIVYAIKNGVIG